MKTQPRTTDYMRLASVEITQRCNRQCAYCDQPKSDRAMPVTQFVDLIHELAQEGVEAVALGGGEPTLHPELPALLSAVRRGGLHAGLTTNARDPCMVTALADAGLLEGFGVSAGKGEWLILATHPRATVNLLSLRGRTAEVARLAAAAVRRGARRLLLLGYKGDQPEFVPFTTELAEVYGLLNMLGRWAGVTIAADDYTRRRLGLSDTCGEGFIRVNLDGTREQCCFHTCEYRCGQSTGGNCLEFIDQRV